MKDPKIASAIKIFRKRYKDGNLSFEDFLILSQKRCFYCDSVPNNKYNCATKKSSKNAKDNGTFIYNGLDRIDNSLPHNKDNVVTCCFLCNSAKSNKHVLDFLNHVCKIKDNLENKKAVFWTAFY